MILGTLNAVLVVKMTPEGGEIDVRVICDPASQNHQKVARHGFLVKGRF